MRPLILMLLSLSFGLSAFAFEAEEITMIDYPHPPGTNLWFAAPGRYAKHPSVIEDRICQILGYPKGLPESSHVMDQSGYKLVLSEAGRPVGVDNGGAIVSIGCLGKKGTPAEFPRLVVLDTWDLVYPGGLPFSYPALPSYSPSNEDGICKVLGYKQAVKDSSEYYSTPENTVKPELCVQVNKDGKLISGNWGVRLYSLICVE